MPALLPLLVAAALMAVPAGVTDAVVGAPSIEMTVVNWGEPVTLLDPDEPAWGHTFLNGAVSTVTVTIDTGGGRFVGYVGHLNTPNTPTPPDQYCFDESHVIESAVVCQFDVTLVPGENDIDFEFSASGGALSVEAHGTLFGGDPDQISAFQVRDAYGAWQFVGGGGAVALPATGISAVQFTLVNAGTIPVRIPGSCSHAILYPKSQLVCQVRSGRPGVALSGPYRLTLHVIDAVGTELEPILTMRVAVPGVRR